MNNNAIVIENSGVRKTFTLDKDKIVSTEIFNKLSGLTIKSGEDSVK